MAQAEAFPPLTALRDQDKVVPKLTAGAEFVATCRVAFPEVLSVFTRRLKNGELSPSHHEVLTGALTTDWPHFVSLDFNEREAGRLVLIHGLRGFDAVHLTSALLLRQSSPSADLAFSSFDTQQCLSARKEGLNVLEL